MKRPIWRLLWNSRREAVFDIALVAALEVLGRLLLHLFPEQIPRRATTGSAAGTSAPCFRT
ncbi:hypothetical protein ACFQ0O_04380 [Saccharopolyspora spinosporotrichia]